MSSEAGITIVRHPEVTPDIKGTCYGVTDVELSADGLASIPRIAAELKDYRPSKVYHSGLTRARLLAQEVASVAGCELAVDRRFCEINFGAWENRTWASVFAEAGDDMARIIHEPATYAPPEGETVYQLRDRVLAGLRDISSEQRTIVVAHGGPISIVRGLLADLPATQWPGLVPDYGEAVDLSLANLAKLAGR